MELRDSVDRILDNESLVAERFYRNFFERCPEVRPLFAHLDMTTQAIMLTMALKAVREHPKLTNASRMYLQVLGTRHRRVNVGRELYPKFLDSLLATLEEFHGPDWSEALAAQWRAAFDDAAKIMYEGYERRFHV